MFRPEAFATSAFRQGKYYGANRLSGFEIDGFSLEMCDK